MNIEYVPIEEVKPYSKNAKIHSKSQIEKIAKSIEKFGWKQNLVIDKDGVLVVGHGRYEAAKLLGLKEVPCVRADDLTEDEIRAYRLIDNRISSDEYDLNLEFEELSEIELDMTEFDFDSFSIDDIDEVDGYDKHNDDREYFEKTLTFPIAQYNRNVDEINATVLSDSDKAEAIARLHQLTNAQLEAESSVINPLATGRGVARFDRQSVRTTGDKALDARREVREFMESVHAKERDTIAKRAQQAMTTAMSNALANGSLEFTVNGATYRRKSKRSRSFERVYG